VRAIHALDAQARVVQRACPLFVALAEEGWTHGAVPELAARKYLGDIFDGDASPDTLVLGCTHFPVLVDPIRKAVGPAVVLVDSAETVAREIASIIRASGGSGLGAPHRFLSTDAPERFARVGSLFFGADIDPAQVELVDLAA
jgi:glutamate racemase